MGKLGYDGTPEFSRQRNIVETNTPLLANSIKSDAKPPIRDQREVDTDLLFKKLAETYIKGEILRKGLSAMEPAQYIPIDSDASTVVGAASRLFNTESINGTIITYSMYQKCVDAINDKKWEVRRTYFSPSSIVTQESKTTHTNSTVNNSSSKGFIEQFLENNGIAGSILAMLAISPFQATIFQALSTEESGAKAVQGVQISAGLAMFIELGIKAEKILQIMKTSKVNVPLVEQQLVALSTPQARAQALESFGINYDDFKQSMSLSDYQAIVGYVGEYYSRYGGLAYSGSHLTIDHWIAYLKVSQNQHTMRGCLNTADAYSEDFADMRDPNRNKDPIAGSTSISSPNKKIKISVEVASATRALRERSNDMYDDIINAFMYQITDDQICCLVSIFGAYKDTDFIKTIASLLRLLAVDLSGELIRLENIGRQFLSNFFASVIFELVTDLEKLLQEVLLKLTKTFTVEIEGLERCGGLLTIGYAIMESIRSLAKYVRDLLREIMNTINIFGEQKTGMWTVAADRRHLFGIARILEILAARLDIAAVCDKKLGSTEQRTSPIEKKDIVAGEVIHSILDGSPPSIQLTNQEIDKYFPNVQPQVSERLKYSYGIGSLQNLEKNNNGCSGPISKEETDALFQKFSETIREEFA